MTSNHSKSTNQPKTKHHHGFSLFLRFISPFVRNMAKIDVHVTGAGAGGAAMPRPRYFPQQPRSGLVPPPVGCISKNSAYRPFYSRVTQMALGIG